MGVDNDLLVAGCKRNLLLWDIREPDNYQLLDSNLKEEAEVHCVSIQNDYMVRIE